MRLAVFTSKYPARIATFFERDMRALLETGIEIDVFAISPLEESAWQHALELLSPAQLPRERVHHLTIGSALRSAVPVLRRFRTALSDAWATLRSAARYGPVRLAMTAYALPKAWAWAAQAASSGVRYDHVLGYWGNYAGTCAYAFHRLAAPRAPFSIWLHAGTDLYRAPVFMEEKLRYADNVITCCEFNQAYILKQFAGVPRLAKKLHVSHHGLNLAEFPHRLDGRDTNRLLGVGALSQRKGFDYLIRAAHVLIARGTDVRVEIIGDGDERAALERLAADLGIAQRVEFRGWQPFNGVRDAMQRATLLVHPSDGLGDGLPNVLREAMALGAPVVASRVAGIPDALRDGCGVLVRPQDVGALAAALNRLLMDPDERRAIAVRARRRVDEHYDMWQNGVRLAAILRAKRRSASRASRPSLALTR
ncbi:MAG TPA: glycosyltransferase [Gemmatimonadales bacterium]|jgi:glycosyltransferase involved in cell wall biosynthesis|nr:glycosyltransferase [Gemmatimonadales bacterium]